MPKKKQNFVHLHVHTQYSLLDGACRINDLVNRAAELDQSAIAITDHGCLFGVIDFYSKALDAGVKPIIGTEAYMAPNSRHDRQSTGVKDGGYHLLLLAQNRTGYANLLKLGSIAYTQGFYYKPRIDKEVLREHADGLICTSACLGGEIPAALMQDDRKKAKQIAEIYLDLFGPDRFFIELQKHIPEQDQVNPELMDLADRLGVGTVATNDVHFLMEDDHQPHDALCCISTGKLVSDDSRMRYPRELYLKSTDQMYAAMDHPKWSEACENTNRIADLCELELDFSTSHAPIVKIDKVTETSKKASTKTAPSITGSTEWYKDFCARYRLLPFDQAKDKKLTAAKLKKHCDQSLRELAEAGLLWRYGENGTTDEHRARLDRELKILADKNISAYFLIVWDFVHEARRRGMPCNARGSGVGTMVGYCLGLSNACPVKYGLLFERFTDPDRSEYPDIDIDICQDGRQEIIDYVRTKYGHVAQIITFGSLKARAAIRDVGRVMNLPLPEVDQICKLVGDGLGTTLDKALDQEPDLKKTYKDNPEHKKVIDTARRLEGLSRHAGVHAAGVVLATQPLDNIVPLYQPSGTDQIVTQWDGPTVEKVGLLKMDFLGLRTLSIIEHARQHILQTLDSKTIRKTIDPDGRQPDRWDPLDLDRLEYNDQKVLDLFRRGETSGVFQFESGGMRNLLMAMKPDRLEDLIAANALYRPGPMELIPDYNARKHGQQQVPKAHPIVEKYTAETYGIMIYQEQVMQIVHDLGDVPLREAYTLIKAISKKKAKTIDASRAKFTEGSKKKGLEPKHADELFELILKFAGYGFNKSHSTGYAIVAYQTAYLKTYFPLQYMAAVLTYESVNTDKVVGYMDECKRVLRPGGERGVDVHPPDINVSNVDFTVVYEPDEPRDPDHGHIRFGLSAVKGVGEKAVTAVIEARDKECDFSSLYDFTERVSLGTVNRATIDALIKCGAFDRIHGTDQRAAMIEALDAAIQAGQQAASDRSSGQMNFFAAIADNTAEENTPTAAIKLPNIAPWSEHQLLEHEKAVLGFYVSSHPLDRHRDTIQRFTNTTIADAQNLAADTVVIVGGMITRVRPTFVKTGKSAGKKMAMITLEDHTAAIDGVAFSDVFARDEKLIALDKIVLIEARIDRRREEPNIVAQQLYDIDSAPEHLTTAVNINLQYNDSPAPPDPEQQKQDLANLKTLLRHSSNANGVLVHLTVQSDGYTARFRLDGTRIKVDRTLTERIGTILHNPTCCNLIGPPRVHAPQPRRRSKATPTDTPKPLFDPSAPTAAPAETCASIDRY